MVQQGVSLDNMMGNSQQAQAPEAQVDMQPSSMPSPVSPNNNSMMMYSDMMQQAMQQHGQMMQYNGQQQQIQYVPVPTPVPVQMMPQMVPQMVPVPMPMNFSVPGQMPMQYYMVPPSAEQHQEETQKPGEFLESLMPK